MKHHCNNTLWLIGKTETVQAAKQSLLQRNASNLLVLDFGGLLPPPLSLQHVKRNKAFVQALKRWRVQHWSTESNGMLNHIVESETVLQWQFTTLWSPPVKVYQALSKHWPDLNCVYHYHNPQAYLWGLAWYQNELWSVHENMYG